MLPRTERIHRGLVRARDVTAALLPLLLLLALMAGPPLRQAFVIALAGTVVVKAIVAAVGVSWAVHVRADETGKWLLVERLHKDTAAAIQARMAQPETEPALTSETQASQNMSRISASDAG